MNPRIRPFAAVVLLIFATLPKPAKAWIEMEGPAGSKFAFGALLAPQLDLTQDAVNTPERTLRYTPTLRRARLLMSGQVTPLVGFFFDTDAPNVGLNGDWTPRVLMLDAIVELDFLPEIQLDVGHFLLPFSHIAMQGAGALLGLDYATLYIQEPPSYVDAEGTQWPSNLSWRDVGAMVRGQACKGHLEYRLAVTQGMAKFVGGSGIAPHAWPRVTGRLVFNLFDAEGPATAPGYLYAGLYLNADPNGVLTPKRYVSLAASASYQRQGVELKSTRLDDYAAYNVDLFVDYPLLAGQHSLNAQVDYAYYTRGATAAPTSALFGELGYRIKQIEPLAGVEWAHVHDSGQPDQYYWRVGVNYWVAAHRANLKLDVGQRSLIATRNAAVWAVRMQGQVMF